MRKMQEVTISAGSEALIYVDGSDQAHAMTNPLWGPQNLTYVERAKLAATLRALAEVVDPGTYDEHLERTRVRLGAESVGRA